MAPVAAVPCPRSADPLFCRDQAAMGARTSTLDREVFLWDLSLAYALHLVRFHRLPLAEFAIPMDDCRGLYPAYLLCLFSSVGKPDDSAGKQTQYVTSSSRC